MKPSSAALKWIGPTSATTEYLSRKYGVDLAHLPSGSHDAHGHGADHGADSDKHAEAKKDDHAPKEKPKDEKAGAEKKH